MVARGVVPGRVACALHRLAQAGRISLHHGKLASIDAPQRVYLPTDHHDRHYVAATPLP